MSFKFLCVPGDVDFDGDVTVSDALLVLRVTAKLCENKKIDLRSCICI